MRSYAILLLFLLGYSQATNAQLKTYLGFETGISWDISRVSDAGDLLWHSSVPGNSYGLTLKQEIVPNLALETGISYHGYQSGINLKDNRPDHAGWTKANALLVPLRISYKLQFSDYPISLSPVIGYRLGLLLTDFPYSTNSQITAADGTTFEYFLTENSPSGNLLHLLEFGISTEYNFQNNWQVGLSLGHFTGLSEASTSDILITTQNGSYNSNYSFNGSRIETTARLSIPLSNIWENKDLRIRTSIERSRGRGRSSIRPQRYLYFGGDIGSLWRVFSASNPAVGSRPMSGKGLFRYSNLHTGAYAGILFQNNIGIDLGAYYQRSSLFFALMYDYEVDFVTRNRAPMYLEVPVRARYYQDLYKGRILLVPSFGVSVLTHFSGGSYSAGSDSFTHSTVAGQSNSTVNYSGTRTARVGLMLKAGVGGEYRVPVKFPLYATASLEYNHGLRGIDEIQVTTSINETPSISTIKYNGSGWNLAIGARIPILLGKENRKCGAIPMDR